jgi:simple sugar transport system permease protein
MLDSVTLRLCAGLASALAFRSGLFNLGGEGQIYLGGLAASVVFLSSGNGVFRPLTLLAAAAAALVAGGVMGTISGLLKRYTGANELITSFLLASACTPAADYLIAGPLRDPSGNLLATRRFSPDFLLPHILEPSHLSISLIFALIFVVIAHFFINSTASGYRFRIAGSAPAFARYGGIEQRRYWTPVMGISGALCGITGFFAVAGTYDLCHVQFSGGLGWNGIACALIARNQCLTLIPVALVYSLLNAGADAAQLVAPMSFETSSL